MSTKSRTAFLDLLRILACFLVIVNHCDPGGFSSAPPETFSWFFSVTAVLFSKIAVPVFFMISGYLMLGKIDSWKKVFLRIRRIVIALLAGAVIYALYDALVNIGNFSVTGIIKEIIKVYIRTPSNALWYLYAYLGILLMLPFLQKMASLMEKKDYYIFFAITAVFYSIIPVFGHYFDFVSYNSSFYIPLFEPYVCLLFIGQYFAKFGIGKTKKRLAIAALLSIITLTLSVIGVYFEHFSPNLNYDIFTGRKYLPVVLQSTTIFYIISCVKLSEKPAKFISNIGACTFGIFLISDMIIALEKPLYLAVCNVIPSPVAMVMFEVCVFITGLIITMILRRIPYVNKIV